MTRKRKSKKFQRRVWRILLFICTALFIYYAYWWWIYGRARFVRYPEFGIAIPESYSIHGIDVSKYQQAIAWDAVKAMRVRKIKIGFAFIKATEGLVNIDSQFKRNWKKAKEAGVARGAYHFFLATKDGKLQAENFIRSVNLMPGDLPPVLDVEQTYGVPADSLKKRVKQWLDVTEEYYGAKPIIYTNVEFYKKNLGHGFDDYPLWVAHYYQPAQPRINRDWAFWQHSDQGRVDGILSKVDFNVFAGDSLEFRNILLP